MFAKELQFGKTFLPSALLLMLVTSMAFANTPGRGLTADLEIEYLKSIIDHHYSALRMTELAAGTDLERDTSINPDEGTSPTPDTAPTPAKASSETIRSMARANNRSQREQILTAQGFLRTWYGIEYAPTIPEEARDAIDLLEQTPAGNDFDQFFMEVFSRHHYKALGPSLTCIVASDITHEALHRYCNQIVHSQVADIQNMRKSLAEEFGLVDYQPTEGIGGRHSSPERIEEGGEEKVE